MDRNSYVINKYNFTNILMYSFGSKGKGRAQFESVSGFFTDMDRQVLVGDSAKGIADVFKVESGKPYEPRIENLSPMGSIYSLVSVPNSLGRQGCFVRDSCK